MNFLRQCFWKLSSDKQRDATEITKDSTFAAMAGQKYKVTFQRVQWAFSAKCPLHALYFWPAIAEKVESLVTDIVTDVPTMAHRSKDKHYFHSFWSIGNYHKSVGYLWPPMKRRGI